jgi:hypothetical protein
MGQVFPGNAAMTEAVRRAIQNSQDEFLLDRVGHGEYVSRERGTHATSGPPLWPRGQRKEGPAMAWPNPELNFLRRTEPVAFSCSGKRHRERPRRLDFGTPAQTEPTNRIVHACSKRDLRGRRRSNGRYPPFGRPRSGSPIWSIETAGRRHCSRFAWRRFEKERLSWMLR